MLYAQDRQTITIVVKRDSASAETQGNKVAETEETGGGGASGGSTGSGQTTWRTSVFGSESPQRIKRVIKTNLTHAWAVSRQINNLAFNYKIQGIGYEYGDQAYQQTLQREVEELQDTTSIASSISMGALYGSWGGPVGMIAGAVLNGASTAVSVGVKYKYRNRDFSYKVFKQENGIAYKRARAGINLTTGRLR